MTRPLSSRTTRTPHACTISTCEVRRGGAVLHCTRIKTKAKTLSITPAMCVVVWFFRICRLPYLRSFRDLSVLYKCSTIYSLFNSVCLLALSLPDGHVLAIRRCEPFVMCCVVLAVLQYLEQEMLDSNMLVHDTFVQKLAHKSKTK